MTHAPAPHLVLVLGGVILVAWYGWRSFSPRDRSAAPPHPGFPPSPRIAREALAGEFRTGPVATALAGGAVTCSACGTEFPAGIPYCDGCGTETVDSDDIEAAPPPIEMDPVEPAGDPGELACIHVAQNHLQASLLRLALDNQQVPSISEGSCAEGLYGLATTPLAEVRIYVHARHAARARAIIRECLAEDRSE